MHNLPPGFCKGLPVHISIDNSDGKQQTLTGASTTHYTNGTVFQHKRDYHDEVHVAENIHEEIICEEEIKDDEVYGTYKIKQKVSPPTTTFEDDKKNDTLKWCMKRDLAWILTSAIGDELSSSDMLEPLGSWTNFMKQVTETNTEKCFLEYLPVVPLPPGDNVCKWYLDLLVKMIDDLEADCIFLHADEAVYSKVMMIKWLHDDNYNKIIPLLGGFHTLLVKLKILRKKYGILGLKEWWIDAEAIQAGSAEKADEGRHYSRSIRLHKQSFEALVRYRIQEETKLDTLSEEMKRALKNLREEPCSTHLNALFLNKDFGVFCRNVLSTKGTMSEMVVEYLKDVSSILAMVSAVREMTIERHLQAERALLPQLFAFGHQNYSRYLTYQHVLLKNLHAQNQGAWRELTLNGFGGSLSGQPFSTKHGDLIIERTINREVKVRGGPMQGGYSTSLSAMNKFVKNTHHLAKLRAALRRKLNVLTSSKHKETTSSGKRIHENTITQMVRQLRRYLNPFDDGPVRNFKTGAIIDDKIVHGLLNSTELGEKLLQEFIKNRLLPSENQQVSFFTPIKNPKIDTGLKKTKTTPKVINVLKEDKQAFGILVGKSISLEEAHSYPLTSVPLALASPDGFLRQGSKATLRNHLIDGPNCTIKTALINAKLIIDGWQLLEEFSQNQHGVNFVNHF